MTLQEMIPLARKETKMTHTYFTSNEYLTIQGNMIVFEDGVKTFLDEWIKGKDYLNEGWSEFKN